MNFKPGFNVITGESGAGKSSVIRSIELLTGARGGAKFIRAGEKIGTVEGVFNFEDKKIYREVSDSGRTKAKINGVNIALNDFVENVNGLVRIQSQFSQLELLEPERQLAMLDSCLPEKIRNEKFSEFHEIYNTAKESVKNLRSIKKRRSEIEKLYSNAREIFDLIKISKPEQGLEKQLENQLADITHRIFQRERAEKNLDELTGGLSEDGLISKAEGCFEELYEFADDKDAVKNAFEVLYKAVKNIALNISSDEEENDPAMLEKIESRLGALRRLKRLCNITDENELLNYSDEAYKNLEWLESSYKELEEISLRSTEEKRKANALAMEIRQARYKTAKNLEDKVNILLDELGMSGINFSVNFNGLQKLKYNGADEAEFILKEGSRSGRVEKIASGGELSRLLLALQLSLPDEWLPPTIVFDEVEAGLGGRAAVLSGLQLKKLSTRCQVILVTHEASIAALGTNHILIQRQNNETLINNIDGAERIREIARMLSGSPDMAEAREHAKILLKI